MNRKPTQKMESNKKLDYDSDVIICDNIPEIILVPSSPDKKKKAKVKKHKRKVKLGVNYNNNMETLQITQNFQGKKTKFKCVININSINTINAVCGKKDDSIVRYEKNVCKKEAYYERILPICSRNTCSDVENVFSSCCRSTKSKKYKREVKAKTSLSPVSSVTLSDVLDNNISYEEVSNGNFSPFSSASDEELETLIKRTKLRENKFSIYSAPEYTSTPTKFQDISRITSPFSVENKSIHSDTTLVLNPLSSEAYSPTASVDYIKLDNFEYPERSTLKSNDFDVPYSPTMSPDLIKAETTSVLRAETHDEDDIPYSPTFTPESMKLENIDYDSIMSHNNIYGDMRPPYSLLTPELIYIKSERNDDHKCKIQVKTEIN